MLPASRLLTLVALFVCIAYGQVDRANLNGTVTDSSGAIVPKSRVELISPDTGFKRQLETGPAGVYNATGLPIGTYTLKFSHEGFRPVEVKGIQLFVGQTRTVDARLEVGAITSQVEVEATAVALQQNSAEIGGVVAAQQVRSIPLNGRNWADLMALAPGAIDAGSGGGR